MGAWIGALLFVVGSVSAPINRLSGYGASNGEGSARHC